MKTKLLSFATACAIILVPSTHAFAINDSISQIAEQRIEKSAKELAAETLELTAAKLKDAKKNTSDIKEYVDSRLDDTILLSGKPVKKAQYDNELIDYHNTRFEGEKEVINRGIKLAKRLSFLSFLFVILLATLIIIASYLKRRQKYKVIEKAIENNYPLPPGFLGKDIRPTTIQHIHYTQGQPGTGETTQNITEFKVNDWANFRSGIKWCAWGVAFMLFFLIVDAPIWVFAIIPLIIGLGKLFATYKIQKAIDNANTYSKESEKNQTTPPPFHKNTSEN